MVQIEHRALGALEQDVLPVRERVVEELRGVRDVRPELRGVSQVVLDDLVDRHRQPPVDLGQDLVPLLEDDPELLAQDLLVVEVLDADPHPGRSIGVRGTDPALRGAERVLAQEPFGHLLHLQVVGHDQVRVQAQLQP